LVALFGYIFYQKNVQITKDKIRFRMLYIVRDIESKVIQATKEGKIKSAKEALKYINPAYFKIGIFDKNFKPIYSEIGNNFKTHKSFYIFKDEFYYIFKYPPNDLGIEYIILKDGSFKKYLNKLKLKIFYFIIGFIIFMSIIGYFLAKLFLKPMRDKIKDLDRFIEDTTHELNTPISAILMMVESLKGIEEKKLNRLKASALRLSTMYERLTYSFKDNGTITNIEIFNLRELIKKRVEVFEIIANSKHISIIMRLEDCYIKANKEEIRRVIDNILSNAIKYSYKKAKVYIKLRNKNLIICDRGIGIKKEQLKDIFTRYKRFNKEEGGFGIGLSIVLAICQKYKINIDIKSKHKIGTCFILNFAQIIHS
jgi:two-component system OmpR family sensor kinase